MLTTQVIFTHYYQIGITIGFKAALFIAQSRSHDYHLAFYSVGVMHERFQGAIAREMEISDGNNTLLSIGKNQ